MATSFTRAALGAEGVGADVDLRIGNGYTEGHAELALEHLAGKPGAARSFSQRPTRNKLSWKLPRGYNGPSCIRPQKSSIAVASLRRRISKPVEKMIETHTTVAIERATLRLLGVEGAVQQAAAVVSRSERDRRGSAARRRLGQRRSALVRQRHDPEENDRARSSRRGRFPQGRSYSSCRARPRHEVQAKARELCAAGRTESC